MYIVTLFVYEKQKQIIYVIKNIYLHKYYEQY